MSSEEGQSERVDARRLLASAAVGVALFLATPLLTIEPAQLFRAQISAAVTGFVTTIWLTGALPLGAASLLPLALLPMLGVTSIDKAASAYAHPIIWMYFGGFTIALGVERWGLHRRIALSILQRVGVQPDRIVLGFLLATTLLSMWLSNTAVALLLLPIGLAVVGSIREAKCTTEPNVERFAFGVLIAIAYGASIGGMGTPIGTPPNGLFLSNYAPFVAAGAPPLTFGTWVAFALPIVALLTVGTWLVLVRIVARTDPFEPGPAREMLARAEALPPMSSAERRVLVIFALAALGWLTRQDMELGDALTIPGWWRLLPASAAEDVGDASVAIAAAIAMLTLPSGTRKDEPLLPWNETSRIPWNILFLMGGGIALASAFSASGLAGGLAHLLGGLVRGASPLMMVFAVTVALVFLSEIASNTAITALMLPILSSTAIAAEVDPRLLMLPATLAASCGFMLPIATPPNAIVFASGRVPMRRMAYAGIWVDVLGIIIITAVSYWLIVPGLDIDATSLPAWAIKASQR